MEFDQKEFGRLAERLFDTQHGTIQSELTGGNVWRVHRGNTDLVSIAGLYDVPRYLAYHNKANVEVLRTGPCLIAIEQKETGARFILRVVPSGDRSIPAKLEVHEVIPNTEATDGDIQNYVFSKVRRLGEQQLQLYDVGFSGTFKDRTFDNDKPVLSIRVIGEVGNQRIKQAFNSEKQEKGKTYIDIQISDIIAVASTIRKPLYSQWTP